MTLTLIILINAVLSILIVGAIAVLHTGAILTDRRQHPRSATLLARDSESVSQFPRRTRDRWSPAREQAAQRDEPIAA